MDLQKLAPRWLMRVNPRLATWVFDRLRRWPWVRAQLQKELDGVMQALAPDLKPYTDQVMAHKQLPAHGRPQAEVLSAMAELNRRETVKWKDGHVSGAVYHGDDKHIDFLNAVYAIHSQCNPLHSDVWPSISKYEAEIVSMTAHMLGAGVIPQATDDDRICGVVSSGGTESILLAVKTYRDWARAERGIRRPEMVVPTTAHAAFDKAAQYFNIKLVKVPVDQSFKANSPATARALTRNTILVVGSAPSFPHGVIDPIEALSDLAHRRGIGFHTDACLGAFVLPWAKKLGYPVPAFDFRLPGVTSISADTHKYGYAAKGSSVILYRGLPLRRYQYFKTTDWPGGLYFSPTLAGSRPGAISAACWAAMVSMGKAGYMAATDKILTTAAKIRRCIEAMPELYVLGDPLWVIAFGSRTINIYQVMADLAQRGWCLNGLHRPPCLHLCVTLRHAQSGVAERFGQDLAAAVAHAKHHPEAAQGLAPIYGMASQLPVRSVVGDMLDRYIDFLFRA